MTARVNRWGPYVATFAAITGMLLFALAVVYTFQQQSHVNKQLCIQTVENREAHRVTWDAARSLILASQTDPGAIDRTNEFFDAILETIPPLECIDNKPVVKE